MRSEQRNKATHITRGNVLNDLGFSAEKALALKFKADILIAIVDEIKRKKYTQAELVKVLNEHQPVVSNLLRGKISQMSIEKLLIYADRLGLALDVRRSRSRSRSRRAA
jgi:predicted XRE-type DNA-binding protein